MYMIGVAGGSGAGKTTFIEKLTAKLGWAVTVLQCDDYYKSQDGLSMEQRGQLNFDEPDAIDFSLMVEHVKALQQGQTVQVPQYDFTTHTRRQETTEAVATEVLILDGILLFHHEALRKLMDLKLYVDVDADERILRRLRRDVAQRGRTVDSVIQQYVDFVKPMHNRYVEPTRQYADLILNDAQNDTAVEVVVNQIKSRLGK